MTNAELAAKYEKLGYIDIGMYDDADEFKAVLAALGTSEESGGELQKELQALLNRHSREIESDTPDYILAKYLIGCLDAFETAVQTREVWYGRGPKNDHGTTS